MELHHVRGGTARALTAREYNIGVGVSLGNKWFSIENTLELTKWALAHTREHVVIYVADAIHAINLEVRSRVRYEKTLILANEVGDNFLTNIRWAVESSLEESVRTKLWYAKWNQVSTQDYRAKVNRLYEIYEHDDSFRASIHTIVEKVTSKNPRHFSEKEVHRLGMYIIEELPEVINRVPIVGEVYDAYAYPFDGELTQLVEQIQLGQALSQIKTDVMSTEPKVFLEVR